MKRIYILLLAVLPLGFIACEDGLEYNPDSSITVQNFYKTEADLKLALTAIYSDLGHASTFGSALSIEWMAGVDEAVISRDHPGWTITRNEFTPSTVAIENTWRILYHGINNANVFIERAPEANVKDAAVKDRMLAEARFLRAFYFYNLVRAWGDVPLRTESVKGVDGNNIAKSSAADVYKFIIDELEVVAPKLGVAGEIEYGRASQTAAYGLLVRVYLNRAGYPHQILPEESYAKVIEYADMVINSGKHNLLNDYKEVFMNLIVENNDPTEVIFDVQFSNMRDQGLREGGKIGQLNGIENKTKNSLTGPYSYGFIFAGVSLINSYDTDDDERYAWNIADWKAKKDKPVTQKNQYQWYPGKYKRGQKVLNEDGITYSIETLESGDKNYTGINFPILRYSDILLMKAEAMNELNQRSGAILILNQVRKRAGLTAIDEITVATKEAFRNEIMDERMRELCFEGLRRFDLIRWGVFQEKLQSAKQDMINAGVNNKLAWMYIWAENAQEKHEILPIPLKEIEENDLIKQNTLWE
jgi:hypothetical protein